MAAWGGAGASTSIGGSEGDGSAPMRVANSDSGRAKTNSTGSSRKVAKDVASSRQSWMRSNGTVFSTRMSMRDTGGLRGR